MNTSIITVTAIAVVLFILTLLIWKLTSKKPDITEVDIPEITPEELKKMVDEAEEEKCEEVIEKPEEDDEEEEDVQTVEEYVAEIASKLVDPEGSLTSAKLETEGQDSVLVISEAELKAANEKFEESLKTIGIDPVTGCYVPTEQRKTEKTAKPAKTDKSGKKVDKSTNDKNKKTNKTVKEQTSTKKKLEKHPEKANKTVKNNKARQNKAVNGKKNKKKTNKK